MTTGRYANDTTVPVERSRAEVERILTRYGASMFAYAWQGAEVMIVFQMKRYRVQMRLPLPDPTAKEFTTTQRGQPRVERAARDLYEQACRQRWRALALVVKAKLEAVEVGISTFESEFLSGLVLPGGSTVGQWVEPQLPEVYAGSDAPLLLLPGARQDVPQ